MSLPALVLASGYGSFQGNGTAIPKVVELLGNRPMIARIVETVLEAGFDPCIVVVNPLFSEKVKEAISLAAGAEGKVRFVVQPERRGSADAVERALPILRELGVTDFIVVYGDMPFWKCETMHALASGHTRHGAVLSMVSVAREADPVCFNWYGRIVRDNAGQVSRVVEWKDATSEELALPTVNPSIWGLNVRWFSENVRRVVPCERGDGRPPERYLPPLIQMAHDENQPVFEFPLTDHIQALGVNTLEELERARSVLARVLAS